MGPRHARLTRTAIVVAATTAIALTATGCSRFGGGGDDADVLTIWTVPYAEEGTTSGFEKVIADFTEETGIEVKYTAYPNDELKQQLANATGTSAMPDLFQNWSGIGLLGNIYDAGAIEPLDEYFDEYGWDGRFNEAALSLDQIDGKVQGVPMTVHAMAIVYSKKAFEAAGITEPPTSFDDLLTVNQQLLDAGITPFSFGGKQSWNLMRLSDSLLEASCGAETFDALRNMELDWNSEPCATDAFTVLQQWQGDGYLPADFLALDPNARDNYKAIYDGTAAMTIDGDWIRGGIEDDGQSVDDFGIFPFPTSTDRLYYFTESLYMSSGATDENKDNAAKFIDFISTPENYAEHSTELNSLIPPIVDAESTNVTAFDQQWIDLSSDYSTVYLPSDQAFVPDVADAFLRAQDQLMIGELDPKGVVAAVQTAIDAE